MAVRHDAPDHQPMSVSNWVELLRTLTDFSFECALKQQAGNFYKRENYLKRVANKHGLRYVDDVTVRK